MRTIKIAFISFLLIGLANVNLVFALEGKVIGVADGDTITILTDQKDQVKIRLYGIDCPEKHQDFGMVSKKFTSDFVFGKTVEVEVADTDRYGRTVGIVRNQDGAILNEELIRAGLAWVYVRYCKRTECRTWALIEESAKLSRVGLWSMPNPTPPWEFRKLKKSMKDE